MTLGAVLISQILVLCPFINCPVWCNLLPDFPLISPLLSLRISHLRQSDSFGAYCFPCCVLLSSKLNLPNCQHTRIHFLLCALQCNHYTQLHHCSGGLECSPRMSLLSAQKVGSRREMSSNLSTHRPLFIGRLFWPNVANFGNCIYLPYNLLGCTSRLSHFSTWVRTANEKKNLPEMIIKGLHGSSKLPCCVTSPI